MPLKIGPADKRPKTENGFATLLGLAHLAFYVHAKEANEPPLHDFGGTFKDAFLQIWPIQGPQSYPPRPVLRFEELDAVAETVGTLTS